MNRFDNLNLCLEIHLNKILKNTSNGFFYFIFFFTCFYLTNHKPIKLNQASYTYFVTGMGSNF